MSSPIELGEKRFGPGRFLVVGLVLFVLKFVLDRAVAGIVFGRSWSIVGYLIPHEAFARSAMQPRDRAFYLTMIALALPFIAVGIIVTYRRLRDADLPRWLVAFFFVPAVNLLFFAILSVLPSARPATLGRKRSVSIPAQTVHPATGPAISLDYGTDAELDTVLSRLIPRSRAGAKMVAIVLPAPLAAGATILGALVMRNYGWGLFVGMPFFIGMVSAVLYGYRSPRTIAECQGVGLWATVFAGGLLICFAIEGLGCLLMLMPLALPIAAMGAAVGYAIQRRPDPRDGGSSRSLFSVALTLPAMIVAEGWSPQIAEVMPVTTAVEIAASPEVVWQDVVTFDRIDTPLDWPFLAGVAYPVRARIEGRGVGAVRYCEFSTGPFVEPITVWNQPTLLRFDVTSNPPPMREWSPFDIHPPHLNNFLLSHGGQFKLIALPNGRTRLEGTTWYENRMWPQAYWRAWSDFLIHRIHRRVLNHIRDSSEREGG